MARPVSEPTNRSVLACHSRETAPAEQPNHIPHRSPTALQRASCQTRMPPLNTSGTPLHHLPQARGVPLAWLMPVPVWLGVGGASFKHYPAGVLAARRTSLHSRKGHSLASRSRSRPQCAGVRLWACVRVLTGTTHPLGTLQTKSRHFTPFDTAERLAEYRRPSWTAPLK